MRAGLWRDQAPGVNDVSSSSAFRVRTGALAVRGAVREEKQAEYAEAG